MPATSGTRRGNGPGHGGPARGVGHRLKPAGDAKSDAVREMAAGINPGQGKKARTREILDEASPLAAQFLVDLLEKKQDPRALSAAVSILNKTGFHDKSGIEHSGEGGGPVQIVVRKFFQPPE